MIKKIVLILLSLPCTVKAQFVVGALGITVQPGAIFSTDSLVLQPTAPLVITSNELQHTSTPVTGFAGATSIRRVYRFTNPVSFTGTLGMYYADSELVTNMESGLQLVLYKDSAWAAVPGSTVNTMTNFVSMVLPGIHFRGVTATSSQAPLPVTLLQFTAEKKSHERHTLLSWETAGEDQLDHYDIQRSGDGKMFYTTGSITASGSRHYSYTDQLPLTGINYYRLQMVDKGGTAAYGPTRYVSFETAGTRWQVAPNPATDELVISATIAMNDGMEIVVYNTAGQLMGKYPFTGLSTKISVSSWPSGIYLLYAGDEVFKIEKI